ncbi:MAG: PDZ/DHR/GLGF domain-containing protein [Hyphomonadaceae bacterium]|nr:MAG: PDZ/DHR/GLGF domain-containing protein [Hyphomonadaceae bacterium]
MRKLQNLKKSVAAIGVLMFCMPMGNVQAQSAVNPMMDPARGVLSYSPLQDVFPAVVRIVALQPVGGQSAPTQSQGDRKPISFEYGEDAPNNKKPTAPEQAPPSYPPKPTQPAPARPAAPPQRTTPTAPPIVPPVQMRPSGSGSGVIIDAPNGIIITNHHVVEGAAAIRVDLADGRTMDARLLGSDEATDVAVLKIEAPRLSAVNVTSSDNIRVGDVVFALGYPMGLEQTLTVGVISGLSRSGIGDGIEDYIQTDASVNRGNSGGPLLDSRGRLIGINTAILSPSGGNVGIAFAVPTRVALSIADQIRRNGAVRRGRTGVVVGPISAEQARTMVVPSTLGALVTEVLPQSPAAAAGLRTGDVITRAQGRLIETPGALSSVVGIAEPGTNIDFTYRRDGRDHNARMTVEEPRQVQIAQAATAGGNSSVFGAQYRDVTAEDQIPNLTTGAMIVFVTPGSTAARRGIYPGDVVIAVNRRPVRNAQELTAALQSSGGAKQLMISRGGTLTPVVIQE